MDRMDELQKAAKRMKELDAEHAVLKEKIKVLDEEYDKLRLRTIPDLMQEMDIRKISIEGVGRIQLAGDVYASIPAEVRQSAYEWLRNNNAGPLITETVNSSTLKSWAKEQLTMGVELPENLFKVTPFQRASIVKEK